ncbi:unnamed protein product, partial [marine sediment metagenome]
FWYATPSSSGVRLAPKENKSNKRKMKKKNGLDY